MIQSLSIALAVSPGPVRPKLLATTAGAGDFAVALGALTPPITTDGAGAAIDPLAALRQALAVPGKPLPDEDADADPTGDDDAEVTDEQDTPEDPSTDDIALAWFQPPTPVETAASRPGLPVPAIREPHVAAVRTSGAPIEPALPASAAIPSDAPEPQAASTAPRGGAIAVPPALDDSQPRPAPPVAPRDTQTGQPILQAKALPRTIAVVAPPAPTAPGSAPAPVEVRAEASPQAAAPATPAAPAPNPVPQISGALPMPVQPVAEQAPGIQELRAVAAAALSETRPAQRRADPSDPTSLGLRTLDATAPTNQVAATADAQQGALDMRRQEWTGQMIERIEALRDSAPLRETRIRLSPEALGNVDVSIRRDGDRIHVHFAAEAPAARQMLSEAQPRLAELAEARGMRLGQTSVDGGGTSQGSPNRQSTPEPQTAARPAPAATDDGDQSPLSDARIA